MRDWDWWKNERVREADNLGRRRRLVMKKNIYYIIILNELRTRGDAQTTAPRFSRQ